MVWIQSQGEEQKSRVLSDHLNYKMLKGYYGIYAQWHQRQTAYLSFKTQNQMLKRNNSLYPLCDFVCGHLCRLDQLWGSWFVVTGRDANLQQQRDSKSNMTWIILQNINSLMLLLALIGSQPTQMCVYLDDHAHNRQRENSSRMGRRPTVYVITSCQSNTQ